MIGSLLHLPYVLGRTLKSVVSAEFVISNFEAFSSGQTETPHPPRHVGVPLPKGVGVAQSSRFSNSAAFLRYKTADFLRGESLRYPLTTAA
jgi:hypothetical protein